MKYIPLFCYSFRWNIEVSYYEQKTFWSFCSYMVRSRKGIETLVNLINIAYCAMKILPYQDEAFSKYRTESVQECRFVLSEKIRAEVFLTAFLRNIENNIKSNAVVKATISLQLWRIGYGMVEMAKAHDLNIYSYLKFLLEHRSTKEMTGDQLAELAPWSEKLQSIKNRM